jgi:hypothetical protein
VLVLLDFLVAQFYSPEHLAQTAQSPRECNWRPLTAACTVATMLLEHSYKFLCNCACHGFLLRCQHELPGSLAGLTIYDRRRHGHRRR